MNTLGIVKANLSAYFGRPVTVSYYWPSNWRVRRGPDGGAEDPEPDAPQLLAQYHDETFVQPPWTHLPARDYVPYIVHFQLTLPSFNYLLQAILGHIHPLANIQGEWIPRQIFDAVADVSIWPEFDEAI